ncbi:GGDEF domain-containing protein, partial [Celeribacter arenosi]
MNFPLASGLKIEPRAIDTAALDVLMPMHLVIDSAGLIRRVGPTLLKLREKDGIVGRPVNEVFSIIDNGRGAGDGAVITGTKLYVSFRGGVATPFKGVAVEIAGTGETLMNLSFGISLVSAVSDYRLTAGDFAHTDLAIELLYLVESNAAVMEETKQLNQRLQGAKVAAEEQAFTDTLTGLKNRRAMDQVVSRMIHQKTSFALMHLDLDYFKSVNDTYGHAAGDLVLEYVARVL